MWVTGFATATGTGARLVVSPSASNLSQALPPSGAELASAAFEAVAEAAIVSDDTGTILVVNSAAAEMFGYEPSEMVGQDVGIVLVDQRAGNHVAANSGRLDRGRRYEHRGVKARRKDGSVFPARVVVGEGSGCGQRVFTAVIGDLSCQKALEEDLERFFELSPDPMAIGGLDGTFVKVNPAFEDVLGFTPAEMAGSSYLDYLHPDDVERALDAMRRLGDGDTVEEELRFVCKDGTYRLLSWAVGADPVRGLVFGAGRDVTERHAAEEAHHESEARFQALLDHSPAAVFLKDLSHRFIVANAAAAARFGLEPEDLVGRSLRDVAASSAYAEVVEANEEAVIAERQAMTFEEVLDGPDGEHSYVVVRFPLVDRRGQPYAVCGVATDVTEHARTVTELARREELLEGVYRATPDLIAVVAGGVLQSVSPAVQQMLGWAPEELVGSEAWTFVHPDDRPALDAAVVEARSAEASGAKASSAGAQAGGASIVEARCRLRRRDGTWLAVGMRGQVFTDDASGDRQLVFSCRDITGQLREEARLRGEREVAERADAAKNEFLSRMSHELRTPLNAVLGFAQLLQGGPGADNEQALAQIATAGEHLRGLIDKILDVTAIESGAGDVHLSPVDLRGVLADATSFNRLAAQDRGVVIHEPRWSEDGEWAVAADRQRLLQVLLNVISNAVKYNRRGGEVTVACERPDASTVRVSVTDSGAGIAAQDTDRVFAPFDRLGADRTTTPGTGMGLYLSSKLMDQMGGTITFEPAPGTGTTFHIDIASARTPPSESAIVPASGGVPVLGPIRVVQVDDNHANRALVETVLGSSGATVISAPDGTAGIETIRRERPDIVLLDLHMPGMDGFEVLRRLRADPHTTDIPVIVTTGDARPSVLARASEVGAAAHLTRPFDVITLIKIVGDHARRA